MLVFRIKYSDKIFRFIAGKRVQTGQIWTTVLLYYGMGQTILLHIIIKTVCHLIRIIIFLSVYRSIRKKHLPVQFR